MIKWKPQVMGMSSDEEFELEFQVPDWLPIRFTGDVFRRDVGKWWGVIRLGTTELVRTGLDASSKEEAKALLLKRTEELLQGILTEIRG